MMFGLGIEIIDSKTGKGTIITIEDMEAMLVSCSELDFAALKTAQKKLEDSNVPEIHKAALAHAVKAQSCLVDFNKYTVGQAPDPKIAMGRLLLRLAADEAKRNYAGVIKHNPL